jgi:predicted Fe-S protein YdhL (DUF1289 family)
MPLGATMIAFPAAMFMFAGPVPALASMTIATRPPVIESPCLRICSLDPASNLCMGCGRTIEEITHWYGMGDDKRSRIMAELPARLASLRAANSKPAKQA